MEPYCTVGGNADGAVPVENCMEFQKTRHGSTSWLNDSTAGNIPKKSCNTNSKEPVHSCVYSSGIYNSQELERVF